MKILKKCIHSINVVILCLENIQKVTASSLMTMVLTYWTGIIYLLSMWSNVKY